MEDKVVEQTQNWIKTVVIGCNFCPFAAKAMMRKSVRYVVLPDTTVENTLAKLLQEMQHLDSAADIETTFIIFPNSFTDFHRYLSLVEMAEDLVDEAGYEGVYQVASFHPDYCFADVEADDPANYTNRSIYPMLHVLREDSVSEAVDNYPDAEGIPDRNVAYAREKGLAYMAKLRAACM
jgi:uncharacterized protein